MSSRRAGPLVFDAALARALGWLEAEISELEAHLEHLNREHLERCAERAPLQFRRIEGRLVFTGELPRRRVHPIDASA